ncbi:MAG: hypothetical protein ACK6CT_11390 [Planctomycetia bacterium]|jgi:hypothetical protein
MVPRVWLGAAVVAIVGAAAPLVAFEPASGRADALAGAEAESQENAPDQRAADARPKTEKNDKAEILAKKKAEAEARRKQIQQAQAELQALQAELKKIVVTDPDPESDGPPPTNDPQALQVWNHKQNIRLMAGNFEQWSMRGFQSELELIRQTCGSLPPEVRQKALAAGKAAIGKAALEFANARAAGRPVANVVANVDVRQAGIDAVMALVRPETSAEDVAAYEAELRARLDRRRKQARAILLLSLDAELELTASQRDAITAALERDWKDAWTTSVMTFNGTALSSAVPDFATDCVAPALTPRQLEKWKRWRGQASRSTLVGSPDFHFEALSGLGVLSPDEWWGE